MNLQNGQRVNFLQVDQLMDCYEVCTIIKLNLCSFIYMCGYKCHPSCVLCNKPSS
jgi:hypothetical protein